jgi:glycyl-tRNA synthetase beta chain
MGLIREGNERVLTARLADAKFFFDEDRKVKLEERTTKLCGIIFHQKLGTLSDKTKRTKDLVESLAKEVGDAKCVVISTRAAELANNDIVTAVVGEFPNLQGVMGSEYARHDGEDPSVAIAIAERYLPRGMEGPIPQSLEGQLLSFADRLDKIAGFFRVGIVPKGSEDPYALRRDALSIVRILVEGDLSLKLEPALDKAEEILAESNIEDLQVDIAQGPFDFIVERFRYYAGTAGGLTRNDVIDAVLTLTNTHTLSFKELLERMKALESVTTKSEFDPLIVGFKRAHRIVEKEGWKEVSVDPALFNNPVETELHRQIRICRNDFDQHKAMGDYQSALDALIRLKPAIDAFFDSVMVNADVPAVRGNRLSQLKEVDDFFNSFADFSQIVVQGG